MEEDPALQDVSEKELLLEIFREVRSLRRMFLWVFILAPFIAMVITVIMVAANS